MKRTRLIGGALRSVEALLPEVWRLDVEADGRAVSPRADAIAVLTGPGGSTARFIVEARGSGTSTRLLLARLQDLPLGVRALASFAEVSPGSVSKVLPTLADEGALDRGERGAVTAVRRRALIRRWVQNYSFLATNGSPRHYIAPRGLARTLDRLADLPAPVTLTGSAAARRWLADGATSVVPLRLLALYADDLESLADALGLIPADPAIANAVIAIPQDRRVLTDHLAPASLVLADLLTLSGRADAEAEQFMDTLARTDPAWGE